MLAVMLTLIRLVRYYPCNAETWPPLVSLHGLYAQMLRNLCSGRWRPPDKAADGADRRQSFAPRAIDFAKSLPGNSPWQETKAWRILMPIDLILLEISTAS